jgi:hypothetical protein
MDAFRSIVAQDEDFLGRLAMQFRGTRNEEIRREIANEYSRTVQRLIGTGRWDEMPAFEDQLPDEWMPAEFFEYWK